MDAHEPAEANGAPAAATLVVQAASAFTGRGDSCGGAASAGCQAQGLAVGVAGDRIAWVAPAEEAGSARFPMAAGAVVADYGEAFLMPGFHDAHVHFFHTALYGSPLAEQFVGTSEQDCVARLAPLAARRPAGSWLLAQGWREYLWDVPVAPTRASLDAAYPDRPVALYSGDAHTLWLNGCALERLGIGKGSQAPAGGSYERDGEGRLTGIVREAAAMELMPRIMEGFGRAELLEAYRGLMAQLAASGVTAVCDVALMAGPGLDFVRDDLFAELEAAGQLTVRAHLFPTLLPGADRLERLQGQLRGPMLRACGLKQFFDGVSSQHTAWLAEPYANARLPGERGRPTVEPQAMAALVAQATGAGHGVRIHAIGDEAIHRALDIYEQARRAEGPDGPHPVLALEHLENFQPGDVERLAALDVVASVQPRHMTLDPGGPERDLGMERVPLMWPLRSLLDAGATLAFGTDAPVTSVDPLKAVYAAVARRDAETGWPEGGWLPEQRISVADALAAYTAGSARAAGRAHELGALAAGMLADLVVLDRDLLACEPEELLEAQVLATFVGGRQVHGA